MNTQTITLDSEHRYWRGDERLPGFTEICKALGIGDNKYWTDDGREEGTALHLWTHFLAQGQEPDAEPDPRIAGRVQAFRNFLKESGFIFAGGEQIQFEPTLRYCCTPDLWGHIGAWSWVIDVKRGAKVSSHSLQTAAQKLALRAGGFLAQKRGSLYLKDDGTYRLIEHTDVSDETNWRAIVAGYHARAAYIKGDA